MARGVCSGCRNNSRVTRRVDLCVYWPGGGVKLVELVLCGACCAALLDMMDSNTFHAGLQVELPGMEGERYLSTRVADPSDPPRAKQRRKRE